MEFKVGIGISLQIVIPKGKKDGGKVEFIGYLLVVWYVHLIWRGRKKVDFVSVLQVCLKDDF